MSPLSYLLFTRFKNQIKGVFRSPAKLIYAIALIAVMVLVVVGGQAIIAEQQNLTRGESFAAGEQVWLSWPEASEIPLED